MNKVSALIPEESLQSSIKFPERSIAEWKINTKLKILLTFPSSSVQSLEGTLLCPPSLFIDNNHAVRSDSPTDLEIV